MFTAEQYRAKATEYSKMAATANGPNELREFQALERNFTELADNAQWVIENYDETVHAAEHPRPSGRVYGQSARELGDDRVGQN